MFTSEQEARLRLRLGCSYLRSGLGPEYLPIQESITMVPSSLLSCQADERLIIIKQQVSSRSNKRESSSEEREMKALLSSKPRRIVLFLLLELLSIAMGMGVPFFTILFGFIVGLYIPRINPPTFELSPQYLRSLLRAALVTSAITLLIMAGIWLPTLKWLFDPSLDVSNFGIPMILYSPRASFAGWIILMVLISPFLKFLMTLFGSISWIVFFKDRLRIKASLSGDGPTG